MDDNKKENMLRQLEEHIQLKNYSKETAKIYLIHIKKYFEYLKDEEPNFQNAKKYILQKLEKNQPSSVHHNIFAIEYFFKNILNQRIYIPKPKRNKKIPEILTPAEIKKMIDITSNIKHKLILKILYGCDLRVSEVINLEKDDMNFDEKLMYIRLAKGKKDRFVGIPESILKEIEAYILLNNEKTLFPSSHGGKLTKTKF